MPIKRLWHSLRGRLLLLALVVEALMLAIMISNSLRLLRDEMGDQAREQAEQIAPVLTAALVAPLAQLDYATVQAVLDESHAIRGIDYLAVTDSSGTIVATSGWPTNTALPRVDPQFTLDDDDNPPRYDLALPIRLAGQSLGTLQFGLDLKRIVAARKSLLTQAIIIAVSELMLSAGLLALLGVLITRQLSVLTQASLKVANGDLLPDPVPEGQDDIGRFGAAFNVMASAIKERIDQLTRANEETRRMASALEDNRRQLERGNAALRAENAIRLDTQRELEAALERVREHTEQLRAIFDLSPDGFVSFDADGRVKYASPAYCQMVGEDAAEVVGLGAEVFSARLASKCLATARFPGLESLAQKLLLRSEPDGKPRRLLIELAAGKRVLEVNLRRSASGTVSQILYFRDVTHETEVDRMKSEFLSHAAHELRTPMASIYGFSELMLSMDFTEEERKDHLQTIHRQSELMVAIINELLDLVRIEERRGKDFHRVSTDLAQLVQQLVSDYGVPAGRSAATLTLPGDVPRVLADPKKLMQALRNVLSNAYKYSSAGDAVEIALVCAGTEESGVEAARGVRVGIRVTDQGIGMTPQQLAHVCERFYRADTSGNIPGTGLGMCIVKEIIELHEGRLDLRSEPGVGTVVTLWLPAAEPTVTPTPA